jgi:hypothetical protein
MSDTKRAKLILERWSSELANKDRTSTNVVGNFEELFHDMWSANIPFDEAHKLLNEAIASHLPSQSIAKLTYKGLKSQIDKTYSEFLEDWKKSISNKATQAFYSFYPVDGENIKKKKKFGNMSIQEYNKQRKHIESFPVLDTDELQKKIDEMLKEEDNE